MEIVRKSKTTHAFRVVKSFHWGGSSKSAGEEIEISDPAEAAGLVQSGRVIPADLPGTAEYIGLRDLKLAGTKKFFEAKKMERVILRSDQALKLMIEGAIIPVDENQWRPNDRRLKK
jgi:hypothetical protein